MKRTLISAIVLCAVAAIVACSGNAAPTAAPVTSTPIVQATSASGIANPASVFCEKNGGKLEFRQDAQNGTTGICVFTDKSECEEWAYYRGECKPGDKPITK